MLKLKNRENHIIIITILFIISIGIYYQSLFNAFVYDDLAVVETNTFIKNFKNLPYLFHKDYFICAHEATYRPMVTLTYFLDYSIWKFKPFGYHLTNFILHFFNIILVYLIAHYLFKRYLHAFLAALIFAVHPLQTEAVCNIGFREDVLYSVFYLAAIILYLKSKLSKGFKKILLLFVSYVFYFLGMLSKEAAVTLPAVLLLYEIVIEKKAICFNTPVFARFKYYSGYIVFLAIFAWLRFIVFVYPEEKELGYFGGSFYNSFISTVVIFYRYIRLFLTPAPLCVDYTPDPIMTWAEPEFLAAAVVWLLVIGTACIFYRAYKLCFFGIMWFLVTLIPASNIIPIYHPMAERYLYLPLFGLILFFSLLWKKLIYRGSIWRSYAVLAFIFVVFFYTILTFCRTADWKDRTTLWQETLEVNRKSFCAYNEVGIYYSNSALYEQAIKAFMTANFLNPTPQHTFNLGCIYLARGEKEKAENTWQKTIHAFPSYQNAYLALGELYVSLKLYDEAETIFKKAIAVDPYNPDVYNFLGSLYYVKNDYKNVEKYFKMANQLDPQNKNISYNLAMSYKNSGDLNKAFRWFVEVYESDTDDLFSLTQLAVIELERKNYQAAKRLIKECIYKDESFPFAHYQLGIVCLELGNLILAEEEFQKTLSLDKDFSYIQETRKNNDEMPVKKEPFKPQYNNQANN